MLKLGEKIISDIYLGDKKIAKVFLGDKLVYQAGKPIFLDYVEFDGNSRIDTGVIPSNNMEFETGVMFSAVQSTNLSIIASRDGEKRFQPIGAIQNKWSASIGGVYDSNGSPISANIRYDLRAVVSNGDSISLYSGNTLVSSATSSGGIPTKSLYLFARNFSPVDSYVTGRLYYCKIWNDGTLIQDLRPCIDHKGVVCFYDMVTKKYFYNQGTGTLTAGNVIKFVDYIVFDGNSYIDTGYKPNSNSSVKVTYYPHYNTTFACVFGSQDSATNNRFYVVISSTLYKTQFCSASLSRYFGISANGLLDYNQNFTDIQQKVGITIDNYNKQVSVESEELTKTYNMADVHLGLGIVDCQYSMFLGDRPTGGLPSNNKFKGKIYGCQIYEEGVLIQDLRPCVVAGEAYFYDMITGKVFTNAGTGTLKASGRFVESIYFDGNSYIDTDIAPQTCTVKTAVKYEANKGRRMLTGFSGSGSYWGMNTDGLFELGGRLVYNTDLTDYTEVEFALDTTNNIIYSKADGIEFEFGTVSTTEKYTIGCTSPSSSNKIIGNVYYSTFYNADGELIQDLRPYVDENNVACFKDVVTGNLFYNQGTGTLGYTE